MLRVLLSGVPRGHSSVFTCTGGRPVAVIGANSDLKGLSRVPRFRSPSLLAKIAKASVVDHATGWRSVTAFRRCRRFGEEATALSVQIGPHVDEGRRPYWWEQAQGLCQVYVLSTSDGCIVGRDYQGI